MATVSVRHRIRTNGGARGKGLMVDRLDDGDIVVGFRGGNTGERAEVDLRAADWDDLAEAISGGESWSAPLADGCSLVWSPHPRIRGGHLSIVGPRGGRRSDAFINLYGLEDVAGV